MSALQRLQPFRPTDVHHSPHARQEPVTGSATAQAQCVSGAPASSITAHEEHSRRVAVAAAERLRQLPNRVRDLDTVVSTLADIRRQLDEMEARRRAA